MHRLQVGGYAARIYVLHHPGNGPSIAMNVLLIVSPTLLALTDYVLDQQDLRLHLVQKVMQVRQQAGVCLGQALARPPHALPAHYNRIPRLILIATVFF